MTEPPERPLNDPRYYESLGRAIKVIRTSQGLGRGDLAKMTGLSYPYISEIENGKKRASSEALRLIAGVLGMRPSQLFEMAESLGADEMAEAESPRDLPSWFGSHSKATELAMPAGMQIQSPAMMRAGKPRRESATRDNVRRKGLLQKRRQLQELIAGLNEDELDALLMLLSRK